MWECMCYGVRVEVKERHCAADFFLSTFMLVLGAELRPSGLYSEYLYLLSCLISFYLFCLFAFACVYV